MQKKWIVAVVLIAVVGLGGCASTEDDAIESPTDVSASSNSASSASPTADLAAPTEASPSGCSDEIIARYTDITYATVQSISISDAESALGLTGQYQSGCAYSQTTSSGVTQYDIWLVGADEQTREQVAADVTAAGYEATQTPFDTTGGWSSNMARTTVGSSANGSMLWGGSSGTKKDEIYIGLIP
ncbi:hypothetical protein AB1K54_09365 [Microbacterium sp. BWT-B31]|uniref:hypothetical protein n=1 Tax=Microbacterium sp. BWT-B31 TaxID=3232072 RepID=UPI0035295458